ncbi:MAG: DUF3685 domain-containing protein [Cyanobacteria bacterium P01_F01_bin.150]
MSASNEELVQNEPLPLQSDLKKAVIRILIVDNNQIFRSGVSAWLRQYSDFEVLDSIDDGVVALESLPKYLEASNSSQLLVLLGGPLQFSGGSQSRRYSTVMKWCWDIKAVDPTVRVVVVGAEHEDAMAAARQVNADGYGCKTWDEACLLHLLRRAAFGEFQWPEYSIKRSHTKQGPLAQQRFQLRLSGLEQIDHQLNQLLPYVTGARVDDGYDISIVDRWVMAGRCRELKTARWIVNRILATPSLDSLSRQESSDSFFNPYLSTNLSAGQATELSAKMRPTGTVLPEQTMMYASDDGPVESTQRNSNSRKTGGFLGQWRQQLLAIARQPLYQVTSEQAAFPTRRANADNPANKSRQLPIPAPQSSVISSEPSIPLNPTSVRATLFDALRDRLQSPLINQTEHPLEIDILREEKKRELLVLILHKILMLLDDLRYSDVQPQQLQERRSQLFYDLWQSILTDYFGKYYVLQIDEVEKEIVTILSQDARAVDVAIFDQIPFAMELLAHFLFKSPLEIDGVPYSLGTPEAIERAEVLLDNLVIQMGNSVIYPLLNYLADVELIKQNFYQRQLMSSRDIARFRNTLSWHYRRKQLVEEPTAIFESTYPLFILSGLGIKQINIYTSRRTELDQLSGFPLLMTLLLEFRDALSPRLRGAIASVGTGVIYVLTDVIGRAIGLIGRGIIKGVGSAWKDID